MKRAVPVRMPEWPEAHFPTTKQLETYLLFWEHHRKALEPDPGVGLYQKSFWLDPEELDVEPRRQNVSGVNDPIELSSFAG